MKRKDFFLVGSSMVNGKYCDGCTTTNIILRSVECVSVTIVKVILHNTKCGCVIVVNIILHNAERDKKVGIRYKIYDYHAQRKLHREECDCSKDCLA